MASRTDIHCIPSRHRFLNSQCFTSPVRPLRLCSGVSLTTTVTMVVRIRQPTNVTRYARRPTLAPFAYPQASQQSAATVQYLPPLIPLTSPAQHPRPSLYPRTSTRVAVAAAGHRRDREPTAKTRHVQGYYPGFPSTFSTVCALSTPRIQLTSTIQQRPRSRISRTSTSLSCSRARALPTSPLLAVSYSNSITDHPTLAYQVHHPRSSTHTRPVSASVGSQLPVGVVYPFQPQSSCCLSSLAKSPSHRSGSSRAPT